jgi:hypothetical protein
MGQVIQGPWLPRTENAAAKPLPRVSECTIIRLRPPARRDDPRDQAGLLARVEPRG